MTDTPSEKPIELADDDLVVRAKTDRDAFASLYDAYYPVVTQYCLRRLFQRPLAEDIVSEVFLIVARSLPGFSGCTQKDFRCWLFRIASNAINAYLRQSRRRKLLLEEAVRSRACRSAATCSDALDWPVVYQAILELGEREQTIIMLRFYGDCSHDDIAEILGVSAGAVRTALSRTLSGLREHFNRAPRLDAEKRD